EGARRSGVARAAGRCGVRLGRGDRLQLDRGPRPPPASQARLRSHPQRQGCRLPRSPAGVKSIRSYLLLWLVGGLAAGSVAVLAGTYALTRSQVGRMFDEELRQVALAVHVREDNFGQRRVRIARPGFSLSVRAYDANGRTY